MLNDRQRVEALLFPIIFKSVLESGAKRNEDYETCCRCLDAAILEAVRGLEDRRRNSVIRRAVRLHDALTMPNRKGGVSVEKITLQTYYVLQAVLTSGYLELEEESNIAIAIQAIVSVFGDADARLDASARKQARHILETLQRLGYFSGVKFLQEAA